MSILSSLEHWFSVTEADVIKLFVAIQKGEEIVIADAQKAMGWIVHNAPDITAGLAKVEGILVSLDKAKDPAAVAAMSIATAGANNFIQFAQAQQAGQTTTETIAAGYKALVETKAAVANALAAAVK